MKRSHDTTPTQSAPSSSAQLFTHSGVPADRLRSAIGGILERCGSALAAAELHRWAAYDLERQIRYNQGMAESLSEDTSTDVNTR